MVINELYNLKVMLRIQSSITVVGFMVGNVERLYPEIQKYQGILFSLWGRGRQGPRLTSKSKWVGEPD